MSIELEHLTKLYDGQAVVDDVSLAIATGELFVLLGPSGSGKSTLLRMIAGLAAVDAGHVLLHGRDVTDVSAKNRGIGFVFQHYALFRHMTVAENVEFALSVRGVSAADRLKRREDLLQLVGLSGFAGRYPRQLSGGQQQRVALARALAHQPEVLLLDEPFGALDAKIRLELREALRAIQRELDLTTVFVTHDQEEAFELADRIAVLHEGRILEVGEPRELYLRPRSPFVATFLGAANLVVGESSPRSILLGTVELPLSSELTGGGAPRRVQILFRPEDVELSSNGRGDHPRLGRGRVQARSFAGPFERLRLRLAPLQGVRAVAPAPSFGGDQFLIDAVRPQHETAAFPLPVGAEAWVGVRRFHVLAPATLRLFVDSSESATAEAARDLARAIAARIGGRVLELGHRGHAITSDGGVELSEIGAQTTTGAEGFGIAVIGLEGSRSSSWLTSSSLDAQHLLLVSHPSPVPCRFLVCVAVGEPAKADVRFAERFAWQIGAEATILTVLSETPDPPHAERFLAACQRAMSARGVVSRTLVRRGSVEEEIRAQIEAGKHDLVVVGAPLPEKRRGALRIEGLLEGLLRQPPPCPVLVVRRQSPI